MYERNQRIIYADALRLIAILAVVVNHVALFTKVRFVGREHSFAWIGIWGVDCFFVLTGYLLSRRFFEAILGRKAFPSLAEYASRRFFRIYPLYLVALVASILVAVAVGDGATPGNVGTHLLLVHSLFPQFIDRLNGPFWTMCVDAQFYIVLPLLALGAMRAVRGLSEASRARFIALALALVVVASVGERFIALAREMPAHMDWDHLAVVSRNLPGMGAVFALGAGLALLELRPMVASHARWWYAVSIALGLGLLVALARLPLASSSRTTLLEANTIADLLGGISATLLFYGVSNGGFYWLAARARSPFVQRGARLAYAVYLFHFLIIERASALFPKGLSAPPTALAFAIVVAVPIWLVAEIAYRYVERPSLLLRDRHIEVVSALP